MSDYLLAAREVLRAGPDDGAKASQSFAERYRRRLAAVAEARKLKADVLEAWTAHLVSCDADDPFHAWARVASEAEAREPLGLAKALSPVVASLMERDRASEAAGSPVQVIVDYSATKPDAWMPDDSGYGVGPCRVGDVRVTGDPSRPLIQLSERGAAVYDRAWDGRRCAPGVENDPSAVGKMLRAGRTIRTPSFALSTGQVSYLVRGVGQAYAAVAQHALINGPLHARLVAPIDTQGKYRWVRHDLTAYKGQLTHVEFTARGGDDFEIAMVVQAENPPSDPPDLLLLRLLEGKAAGLDTLAAGYQQILLDACNRLVEGGDAPEASRWLNWALTHSGLFDAEKFEALNDSAGRYLEQERKLLGAATRESRLALAALDGSGVDERVFVRGSPKALGEPAPRRFVEALAGPNPLPIRHGSGRLELARQIADPVLDPLLPRVMVNRIWHHLFGRGIVASVDNFGVLGEAPTHPELLDYLADRFVKEGWSVKRMIRELVLTSAYQMSSQSVEAADQSDPQNLLLHRMRVRRLEGEAIRDAMLAVSGRLDSKMYGPAVPVHLTPFLEGRGRPTSGPLDGDGLRSVYLAVRRNFLSPLLLTFDTPIPFSTVGRRTVSNVPAQALILMNDPFVHQQAETWARRVLAQRESVEERITQMFASAFGRKPTRSELSACSKFVEEQARLHDTGSNEVPPWKDLAHALFNVKEFIYLH